MFYRFRQQANRAWFNFQVKDVLQTRPIVPTKCGLIIFSMISHLDVMMYLVAIKSFYRYLGKGEIVILNDGSLTDGDLALLEKHVKPSSVIHISSIKTSPCPKGSCWERLLAISSLVAQAYVVQLDADSLIQGPIDEVKDCIEQNRSFGLSSAVLGEKIYPMLEVCREMKNIKSDYVEVIAEQSFDKLPNVDQLKYAKSNACFMGFGRGSFSREKVEEFSRGMEAVIGRRWHEWGTEKITSSYIMSNTPGSVVLQHPKYTSFYANPMIDYEKASYIHFIGTHRFVNGLYIRMARKVIKVLTNGRGHA